VSQRPTLTGIATLLDLIGRDTGLSRTDIGQLLGYRYEAKDPEPPRPPPTGGAAGDEEVRMQQAPTGSSPRAFDPRALAYWYVAETRPFEPPATPEPLPVEAPEQAPPPVGDPAYRELPLLPWRRLWPFVRKSLLRQRETRQVDIACWIRALAEARPLNRIPRQRRAALAGRILLVQDGAAPLMPFQLDFERLAARLIRLFGRNRVERIRLGRRLTAGKIETRLRAHHLDAGDGMVILSDLGQYPPHGRRLACWRALGRHWRRQGVRPLVLTPCPGRYHQAALRADFQLAVLDQTSRLSTVPPSAPQPDRARRKLLAMLSAAQWASPALLRWWRVQLLPGEADVGSEYEAWWDRRAWREPGACGLEPEALPLARHDFRDELTAAQRSRAARAVVAAHSNLPPALIAEEDLIHHALGESDGAYGCAWLAKSQEGRQRETDAWLARLASRQEAGFWERNPTAAEACLAALQRLGSHLSPPGMEARRLSSSRPPRGYQLWQQGRWLLAVPADAERQGPGCRLTEFRHADHAWRVYCHDGSRGWETRQPLTQAIKLPDSGRIVLHADSGDIVLETLRQPEWSQGIGRDAHGLFVIPAPECRQYIDNRSHYLALHHEQRAKPPWALTHGYDEHGRYADFAIDGIRQRMRWIPPGEFLMGSPPGEPERRENEGPQHRVRFEQGFWLAETACTQALWQAVMGENPSDFEGGENPVEMVSWNGAKQFIEKTNHLHPGLELRLPSEAEWEYACRAGTTTPFWFGSELTTDKANYDGNHPYADGPKGEYREKTVPARHFQPNPWGLYQMHGNVWEWCEDRWHDNYEGAPEDGQPWQAGGGQELAVLRGGSWFNSGRSLRSAFRLFGRRVRRLDGHGFRLARGPERQLVQPSGASAASAQPERGTSEADPKQRRRGWNVNKWWKKLFR